MSERRESGWWWFRWRDGSLPGVVCVVGERVFLIGRASYLPLADCEEYGAFGGRIEPPPADAEREADSVAAGRAISGVDEAEAQREFLEAGGDPESTFVRYWHGTGMLQAFPDGGEKDGGK